MAAAKKKKKLPRGTVVYKQLGPKNWAASVIGSNGKHITRGTGWDFLGKAEGGMAAAARIIKTGRVIVIRLDPKRKATKKAKKKS